ncbi:MAG: thiamine diphosphokinase [Gaiellales bacterium]|nr:thiamine diphosphokinase [Gaiellales bacterium]
MHALVIAGSALEEGMDPGCLEPPDVLYLADGGANHLDAVSDTLTAAKPWVLVGDMDSISAGARRRVEEAGGEVVTLPAAKDETDLEHTLRLAVERGAEQATVLGALGGPRLDHLLGAVTLLTAPWLEGCRVRLCDARHEVFLARGQALIRGAVGDTVSLIPLTPDVREVVTESLAYPLRGEVLAQGSTRGVSNVMLSTEARVCHGEGRLLVVHYREPAVPVASAATLACQFSLYPLRQQSLDQAIRAGLEAATRSGAPRGISVQLQPLSTLLQGERNAVFAALRAAFDAAEGLGSLVMVCAMTSHTPTEETLADIRGKSIDPWLSSQREGPPNLPG